jgi:hypothetical protein
MTGSCRSETSGGALVASPYEAQYVVAHCFASDNGGSTSASESLLRYRSACADRVHQYMARRKVTMGPHKYFVGQIVVVANVRYPDIRMGERFRVARLIPLEGLDPNILFSSKLNFPDRLLDLMVRTTV